MDEDEDWFDDRVDQDFFYQDHTCRDFREDIALYSKKHGSSAYFVNVPYIRADYRSLDGEQLRYYLFWRDSFWKGEMLMTCEAYLWILAHEIRFDDRDPERTYMLLMKMWDERKRDLVEPVFFAEFIRDYAILHNLPQPTEAVFGADHNQMVVGCISTCAPFQIENEVFTELCGGRDYSKNAPVAFRRVMNSSLRMIDTVLRRTGEDICTRYCESRIETVHTLFEHYDLLSCRAAVDAPCIVYSPKFKKLVAGIAKYLSSLIRSMRDSDRPDIPDNVARIVEETFKDPYADVGKYDPKNIMTEVKSVDGTYVAHGMHFPADDVVPKVKMADGDAHLHIMLEKAYFRYGSSSNFEEMLDNWDFESEIPVKYVPSEYINPSYDTMSERQKDFYFYWRSQVRKGCCLETDNGYVKLLAAEVLVCEELPSDGVELLRRLKDSYGAEVGAFLNEIICEYCIVNFLPLGHSDRCTDHVMSASVYNCFGYGPVRDLSPETLAFIMQVSVKEVTDCGEPFLRIFNESLKTIDAERTALGVPGFIDFFNIPTAELPAFYAISHEIRIEPRCDRYDVVVLRNNSTFRMFIKGLYKTVDALMRRAMGRKVKEVKIPKYHGERTLTIVEECIRKELSRPVPNKVVPKKKLILDRDAVNAADSDLKAVTDMISAEEEDPEPAAEIVPDVVNEPSGTADGWTDFCSKLDDEQRRYLLSCLNGADDSDDIARHSKYRTVSKIEDAINVTAFDIVGDTVVEYGEVVEEYAADLKGPLMQIHEK